MTPEQRPKTSEIPTQPGVYRWLDRRGRVIYVGKAKNLRQRLTSYFQYFTDPSKMHPRTAKMVATAASLTWVVVASEVEALTLEYTWIKEYDPAFNVMFKDDKSYPYFAVTMNQEYPRMGVLRTAHQRGVRYFGPYTAVWAIRQTLDLLETVLPLRTCSDAVFSRALSQQRACLKGHIGRCTAPCIGRISHPEYLELANQVCEVMSGHQSGLRRQLESQMWQASAEFRFEDAAKLRDQLQALEKVQEKNAAVLGDEVDADLWALVADELQVSVQLFYVRAGRIRGQRGWVSTREDDADEAALLALALEQIYGEVAAATSPALLGPSSANDVAHRANEIVPREVLVNLEPAGKATLEKWLGNLRGAAVSLRCPQRGPKKAALERVELNAQESLKLYKTRRATDLTQRNLALNELGQMLGIDPPLRIECYDISHTQGTHRVASMVVFEDGAPRKNAYRRFNLRGEDPEEHTDDTAGMKEVLQRRFAKLIEEESQRGQEDATTVQSPQAFSYRPDLVVVDGALPQVHAAREAMDAAGAWDIPVVGLAKRLEEVWVLGSEYPVIFPRTSEALYLLQFLRDESHRFAITAHRQKRTKAMTRSVLDDIPGLGPAKQTALLKHFGSLKRLRSAQVEDIAKIPGFGLKSAQNLHNYLHSSGGNE